MVRNSGITTIVFTGRTTEMSVESSARDVVNPDFYPVIVSDIVHSFLDKDAQTYL
jgi:nicotinamidase-related amidase